MTCRSVVPSLGMRPLVRGSSTLMRLVMDNNPCIGSLFFAIPSVVLRDQTHNHHLYKLCFHSD